MFIKYNKATKPKFPYSNRQTKQPRDYHILRFITYTGVVSMFNMQYKRLWQHCGSMSSASGPLTLVSLLFCFARHIRPFWVCYTSDCRSLPYTV